MDTSKKYIKMCKEAKEIQQKRRLKFVWGDIYCDIPVEWIMKGKPPSISIVALPEKRHIEDTWLPRQDQMQEMVIFPNDVSCSGWLSRLQCFYGNEYFDKGRDCESMEELWLGFVMKEKYNKVWDDKNEKWIR